jgi:hypothetical protein
MRVRVVFPDWRGPVTETTGYCSERRFSVGARVLVNMEKLYDCLLGCQIES